MKTIVDFPNYAVTEDGQVWSKRRKGTSGGPLIPHIRKDLHLQVKLHCGKKWRTRKIHQLVLEAFVGPCPSGMMCRHLNGDPANNRLENLKWGTRSENQLDSVQHGTHYSSGRYGEDHPTAKLSNKDRRLIIYQYSTGLFNKSELSRLYKVSRTNIRALVNGNLWPFVKAVRVSA